MPTRLQPVLPTIEGNVDYQLFREQLVRIDELLLASGAERQYIDDCLQEWLAQQSQSNLGAHAQQSYQIQTRRALRCNIARTLVGEDFRAFSTRLADSPLLQWFCDLSELDRVRVPSKSTLQRYAHWSPLQSVDSLINRLLRQGHQDPQSLGLARELDLDTYFLDTTCLEANIHYPVDWVLLRDATRTLMKAVRLIRDQGLKHRMEEPEKFITRMNRLCIAMTQGQKRSDAKKQRKRTLRAMDRLVAQVSRHAQGYRQRLDEQWEQTSWTRPQTQQVLNRLDQVLERLPAARAQARQRILREQPVDNDRKILSFYEPETQVIVRNKAGAKVEFGNTLLIGENPQGLILDWRLFRESAPCDSRLLQESLERTESKLDCQVTEVGGDRGFDSAANREWLDQRDTYNNICPKNPRELKRRQRSAKFRKGQRRRSQTEGRIAILKNVFLGSPLRSKGFEHRELAVGWAVLTHNLWVLARLEQRPSEIEAQAA
jgi:IS5 family transposase